MTPHEVIKKSVEEFEQAYPDIKSGIDNYGTYCDIRNRHYDLYKALLLSVKEMVDEKLTEEIDESKMSEGWKKWWIKVTGNRYIENCQECENATKTKDLQSLLDEEINKVKEL